LQPDVAMEMVHAVANDREARTAALSLLPRVWNAFPAYRDNLLFAMQNDRELLRTPQVFELAKAGLLPTEQTLGENPWHGFMILNHGQRGQITSSVGLVLEAAKANGRLPELCDAVAKAAGDEPRWLAGPALL